MEFYRPSYIENLRNEIRGTSEKAKNKNLARTQLAQQPDKELFNIKPADVWLREEYSKPQMRQLLGSLWYENELCILFADTNLGKSILAVQIGYYLGKQCGMEPFGSQVDGTLKVLYLDFELTPGQFKIRYSDSEHGIHHFGDNFIRAEFNPDGDDPFLYDKYEDYVKDKIAAAIRQTKAQVLIIDNITCMSGETGHAGGALPLMKTLKELKTRFKLSMLVLAHTPKRNPYQPITVNDLQGSKMLINFADSAFAIGQSHHDATLRYIKQIKQRNTGADYGGQHICLFRVMKKQSFLSFEFIGYDTEQAHLQKTGISLNQETEQRIVELYRQGLSLRQMADHLKLSYSAVQRTLVRMKEGEVNFQTIL